MEIGMLFEMVFADSYRISPAVAGSYLKRYWIVISTDDV
ncbi:hypothetical protein Hena1_02470 [Erwinia phage Hena1]|uniref:Uncharacterized protein n=1 Tax=Erwinia phage Hena1 TaxID=2678601 RepID=A0A6B9JIK3_9CAUD|nr:hypothetical protein HWC84_gp117 [Erwinia phage Hena1]QGZ16397.1 hypothetical protein Hena1_02470 [Erwinia phage Hena1]